jgi:putative acetyltransferase
MPTIISEQNPTDPNPTKILEIHNRAFGQQDEAEIVKKIRAEESFDPRLSLVAVEHKQIVGHILFSPITIEAPNNQTPALALGPLAVSPEKQQKGIGSALVREGIQACKSAGHRIIIVLGHPEFYRRFQFTPARPHNIHPPLDWSDESWLVCPLVDHSLEGVSGTVRYPPPWGI